MILKVTVSGENATVCNPAVVSGVGFVRGEYFVRKFAGTLRRPSVRKAVQLRLEKLCTHFAKGRVGYRFTDMLVHEWNKIPDARKFTPEADPNLGFRGIRRLLLTDHELGPEFDMAADISRRHANFHVVLPIVRDEREVRWMQKILSSHGYDGPVHAMIEIPSAVHRLNHIMQLVDGAAIGTNDLTAMLLGAFRTSPFFDKTHPTVLAAIESCARAASLHRKEILVSGHLPPQVFLFVRRLAKRHPLGISVFLADYRRLSKVLPRDMFTDRQTGLIEVREAERTCCASSSVAPWDPLDSRRKTWSTTPLGVSGVIH